MIAIEPTKVSFGQHVGVLGLRSVMGLFGLVSKFRSHSAAPGPVTTHSYGEHRDETLQHIPRAPGSQERAPVVYIHGGGWIAGKMEMYTADLFFLGHAGHPVFNLEYPLAPANPHPGILISLLRALAWIRDAHPEARAVHFMGDSAGGNLAMMLGLLSTNPERLLDFGPRSDAEFPFACRSVVSLYGVLDRLSWLEHKFPGSRLMLECYGGKAAFEPEVGPGLALTPMDLRFEEFPPSFLIAGSEDELCESSQICADDLQRRKGVVEHKEFPGEKHGFFNMTWRPAAEQVRQDILGFLEKHDSE